MRQLCDNCAATVRQLSATYSDNCKTPKPLSAGTVWGPAPLASTLRMDFVPFFPRYCGVGHFLFRLLVGAVDMSCLFHFGFVSRQILALAGRPAACLVRPSRQRLARKRSITLFSTALFFSWLKTKCIYFFPWPKTKHLRPSFKDNVITKDLRTKPYTGFSQDSLCAILSLP